MGQQGQTYQRSCSGWSDVNTESDHSGDVSSQELFEVSGGNMFGWMGMGTLLPVGGIKHVVMWLVPPRVVLLVGLA